MEVELADIHCRDFQETYFVKGSPKADEAVVAWDDTHRCHWPTFFRVVVVLLLQAGLLLGALIIGSESQITWSFEVVGALSTLHVFLIRGPLAGANAPPLHMRIVITLLVFIASVLSILMNSIKRRHMSSWRARGVLLRDISYGLSSFLSIVCFIRWHPPSVRRRSCIRCLLTMRLSDAAHACMDSLTGANGKSDQFAFLFGFCCTLDELIRYGWIPFLIWQRVSALNVPIHRWQSCWHLYMGVACLGATVDVHLMHKTWSILPGMPWLRKILQVSSAMCFAIFVTGAVDAFLKKLRKGLPEDACAERVLKREFATIIFLALAVVLRKSGGWWYLFCVHAHFQKQMTQDEERNFFLMYFLPVCTAEAALALCIAILSGLASLRAARLSVALKHPHAPCQPSDHSQQTCSEHATACLSASETLRHGLLDVLAS